MPGGPVGWILFISLAAAAVCAVGLVGLRWWREREVSDPSTAGWILVGVLTAVLIGGVAIAAIGEGRAGPSRSTSSGISLADLLAGDPAPSPIVTSTPVSTPEPSATPAPPTSESGGVGGTTGTPDATPRPDPTAASRPTRAPTPAPTASLRPTAPTPTPRPTPTSDPTATPTATPSPTATPAATQRPLTASASCATSGFVVRCEGSSSRDGVTYQWRFEDGPRLEGQEVTWTYLLPGRYTIRLTVVDGAEDARDAVDVSVPAFD